MCGIVGYWSRNKRIDSHIIQLMSNEIRHRGPDDSGVWMDSRTSLALAHRRLSIIDLTKAGHQPMQSNCGRFVLIFNGEIYNHLDIRRKLGCENVNINWRGRSDTETLLTSIQFWGVKKTLRSLDGMFAFALWDVSKQELTLARDRMGEKPLYYGENNGSLFFGSELRSFRPHPDWNGQVDRNALSLFMRYSVVPSPWSIYQGIKKLPPAHFVVIGASGNIGRPRCYWSLLGIYGQNLKKKEFDSDELVDELDTLLNNTVSSRMMSDVPLGVFLSGGVDSTMVAALSQRQSDRPIQTFTIGFEEREYNEAIYAHDIARHLETDHTELIVKPSEMMNVIFDIGKTWDEPFADSSQIPTLLVSSLARQNVSVSLSGDGGDELFCGYNRYTKGYQTWKRIRLLPLSVRKHLSKLIEAFPAAPVEYLIQLLPARYQIPHLGNGISKLANIMRQNSDVNYYQSLVSHWDDSDGVVLNSDNLSELFSSFHMFPNVGDFREQMMFVDSVSYLPDDILTKVDRASMSVGLEVRSPLLGHKIVEFAQRVPLSLKYRHGKGKWLLRKALERYVPSSLINRPKMGFGIPIDRWLKQELRGWAEELLDEDRLKREGFFDYVAVRKMWRDYLDGKPQSHYYLWDVLMFQAWLDEQ